MVMQETVFPSIFLDMVAVSYHCSISVAFALLPMPSVSYIFWSSSLTCFTGMGLCFVNLLSAISTIFRSVSAFDIAVSASCIAPTLYFNALTLWSPSFVYASLMNGYTASASSVSQSVVSIIGFSLLISLYLVYMSLKFIPATQ